MRLSTRITFIGAAISCLDIYKRSVNPVDGEYDIWLRGQLVKVYCSGMQVGQPKEYATFSGRPLESDYSAGKPNKR